MAPPGLKPHTLEFPAHIQGVDRISTRAVVVSVKSLPIWVKKPLPNPFGGGGGAPVGIAPRILRNDADVDAATRTYRGSVPENPERR